MPNFDLYPSLQRREDETAAQYQAFIDYIQMGWDRSIEALMNQYRNDKKAGTKPPTTRYATLGTWSSQYEWQKRLGEWREDIAAATLGQQSEYLSDNVGWILEQHTKLRAQIERMIARTQDLTVTKRTRVPDPRDPEKEIEVVYQRVNTRELRELIAAYNDLGEKLRKQLGLKETVELQVTGTKAYTIISPDDWDEDEPEPET